MAASKQSYDLVWLTPTSTWRDLTGAAYSGLEAWDVGVLAGESNKPGCNPSVLGLSL